MSRTPEPLGLETWRRGALLGIVWVMVLFAATGFAWLLLGLGELSTVGRALCAIGIGPVLGLTLIAGWWLVRRPRLNGGEQKRTDS